VRFFGCRCAERVEKLEDDLRRLQSDMQKATLDYLDVYAKAKKLFGRVAKAQAREEAAEQEAGEVIQAGDQPTRFSSLSPRARLIQAQILERRKQMNGGT